MPRFQWKGKNRYGDVVEGVRVARSVDELRLTLEREQITVMDVSRKGVELQIPFLQRGRVKLKELAIFSRQLSVLIDAELPLIQSLNIMAEQQKNKLWSTFADIELYAESIERLLGLCFDYMPSSVEIIEPDELKIKSIDLTNFINDLQARLHRYDMLIKSLNAENILLKRELNKFIKRTKTS